MALFDNVVEKTKDIAEVAYKKANDVVDISKLKLSESDIKRNISKEYEKLGKIVYNAKKTDTDIEDMIKDSISEVDTLYSKLNEIKEQIALSKDKVICSSCHAENEPGFVFCYKCGTKLNLNEKETTNKEE